MRQLIIARKDLNMSPGKLASQVAHASWAFLSQKIRDNAKRMMLSTDYLIPIIIQKQIYEEWFCVFLQKLFVKQKI